MLAWLLTPDDFGLVAIAVTAIGFLLNVTDVGMIPALVQRPNATAEEYDVAWTVGVTRALVVGGVVLLAAPWIADLFAEPRVVPIIRVLVLRPLLEAAASIKVAALTRELNFRALAVIRLGEAIVNAVISVVLADALGVWALVWGVLAGSTTYLVASYLLAPHRPRLLFARSASRSLIRFGRWVFVTGLIVMAGGYVLRIVIARELGAAELGLYFLAGQLAFMPAEVASEVVGAVAFPLFARLQGDLEEARRVLRTTLIGVAALLFPICALLIVLAPVLVTDLLGARWQGTVPVIRTLALVSMIGLFGEVTGPLFQGLGQPSRVTVVEGVQSLLLIVFAGALTVRYGLAGAALAWLPTAIISQGVSYIFLRQRLPHALHGVGGQMILILIVSGVGGGVALWATSVMSGVGGLLGSGLLAGSVVVALFWLLDRRLALGMGDTLSQIFPQLAPFVGHSPVDG